MNSFSTYVTGNVGNSTALAEVVKSWSVVAGRSTKELLLVSLLLVL